MDAFLQGLGYLVLLIAIVLVVENINDYYRKKK